MLGLSLPRVISVCLTTSFTREQERLEYSSQKNRAEYYAVFRTGVPEPSASHPQESLGRSDVLDLTFSTPESHALFIDRETCESRTSANESVRNQNYHRRVIASRQLPDQSVSGDSKPQPDYQHLSKMRTRRVHAVTGAL